MIKQNRMYGTLLNPLYTLFFYFGKYIRQGKGILTKI